MPGVAGAGAALRTSRRSRRRGPPLSVLVPAALAALLALLPLWYLASRAIDRGWSNVIDELWRQRTFDLLVRSVSLAVVVTVACVVIGVGGAWLVVRSDMPGAAIMRVALALPLALPSYLSAFAWVSWSPSLAGFRGAALVLTGVSYPYVYLPAVAALGQLDPAHEEVARSLGRRRFAVAMQVSIRQIRPAISAGAILVMLYVFSDFGAVAAMRYEVFTWVIYGAYRAGFNPSRAAILASALVLLALVLVAMEHRARGRAAAGLGGGAARRAAPVSLGRWRWPSLGLLIVVLIASIGFPLARIAQWVFTFESTSIDRGDVAAALWATMRLAALAAIGVVVLAIPIGVLAARYRTRSSRLIEGATLVTHAVPSIVLAIAMVAVGVTLLRPWYQRTPLLILGYVMLFLPLAVGAVRASIEQSSVRVEEVARSLGAGTWAVVARVTAPLAMPGIAAGAAMAFLATMKELPMTLILRPTSTRTLATRLWDYTAVSDYANAGPYALALVLFATIPAALLSVTATHRGRTIEPVNT